MTENSKILSILKDSPSVFLLRSKNVTLIFEFLLSTFTKEITTISYENLLLRLIDFTSHHKVNLDENRTDTISDSEELKAKNTIRNWTNKGFLTNYRVENGDVYYELSPHTNKTINWIHSLEKKEFVGAESKFKDIFNRLKELVEFTNEDKEKRIEILENRKLQIEHEIQQLKIGEDVKIFEEHEIIPRFQQLTLSAKELLSDFKEVEENFKQITKEIYQKHTDIDLTKSDVLNFTFNAIDDLKESHQGKSFYAFWRFLTDRSLQEEWSELTDELYNTLNEKGIKINDTFLKGMKNYLHVSGKKVYQANDKMADKMSRIIREKSYYNKELTNKVIQEIKSLLTEISKTKDAPEIEMEIETNAIINIPFEKRLTFEHKEVIVYEHNPVLAENDISQSTQLSKIFNQNSIDKNLLRKRIKDILNLKSQTTLYEVIEQNGGIEKGLSELFGYFGVIKEFSHTFNIEKQKDIVFDKAKNKTIKIPEIILIK